MCEGYEPPECEILDITTSVQQACNPLTLTYTQQIVVTHNYAPADGFLIVNMNKRSSVRAHRA